MISLPTVTLPRSAKAVILNDYHPYKTIYVKSKKFECKVVVPEFLSVVIQKDKLRNTVLSLELPKNKEFLLPLYRYLILTTVREAFINQVKIIFLRGIGSKFFFDKFRNYLVLNAGFSHLKGLRIPKSLKAKLMNEKNTFLKLSGSNVLALTQFVEEVKRLKQPDPYKGKGIHEKGVKKILKEGKKQK
jgi:large subunit ribosomal protein L6